MAKELYARFNTLEVKVKDDDTMFALKAVDEGNSISLVGKNLVVKIKNDTGYLKDIPATLKNNYTAQFSSDGLKDLPCGDYSFELWVIDSDTNKTKIFPSSGFQTLSITENVYGNGSDTDGSGNSSETETPNISSLISINEPLNPKKGQLWIQVNELNTIVSLNQWNGTKWIMYSI